MDLLTVLETGKIHFDRNIKVKLRKKPDDIDKLMFPETREILLITYKTYLSGTAI